MMKAVYGNPQDNASLDPKYSNIIFKRLIFYCLFFPRKPHIVPSYDCWYIILHDDSIKDSYNLHVYNQGWYSTRKTR